MSLWHAFQAYDSVRKTPRQTRRRYARHLATLCVTVVGTVNGLLFASLLLFTDVAFAYFYALFTTAAFAIAGVCYSLKANESERLALLQERDAERAFQAVATSVADAPYELVVNVFND